MPLEFPGAVPEIPVTDINEAATYYKNNLGSRSIGAARHSDLRAFPRETARCSWRMQIIESNAGMSGQLSSG